MTTDLLRSWTCLVVGTVLLRLTLDGGYTTYVRAGARPVLLAAALVLVAAGAARLLRREPRARVGRTSTELVTRVGRPEVLAEGTADDHDHGHTHDHGHDHDHTHDHGRSSPVALLLVLPLLLVYAVSPPPLGSDAARRLGSAGSLEGRSADRLSGNGGVYEVALPDIAVRAHRDASLTGLTLRTVGFVQRSGSEVWLSRFVVRCCAADAQPVHVVLDVPSGLEVPADDEWLQVDGTWRPGEGDAAYAPTVVVTEAVRVKRPYEPYA